MTLILYRNLKISTFYQITLVLSWSRQRMKHIYKSILDVLQKIVNIDYFQLPKLYLHSALYISVPK